MRIVCIYIYCDMSRSLLLLLPCLRGSFRRTSRALTQFYEKKLRPLGKIPRAEFLPSRSRPVFEIRKRWGATHAV